MKLTRAAGMLLCLISLGSAIEFLDHSPFKNPSTLCNTENVYCTAKRGHFTDDNFLVISTTPFKSFKLLHSNKTTSFVVIIKSLGNDTDSCVEICNGENCEEINIDGNSVRAYENINNLAIYLKGSKAPVYIQYYAGCEIVSDANLETQYDSTTSKTSCLIMVPQVGQDFHPQDVATIFIAVDRLNLFGSSSLSVTNLLSGDIIQTHVGNKTSEFVDIKPFDPIATTKFNYINNVMLSAIVLFDVQVCKGHPLCNIYSFDLKFIALSLSEVKCLTRERYCLSGIGKGVSCNNESPTECPPLLEILFKFLDADSIPESSLDVDVQSKKISKQALQAQWSKCANKFKKREVFLFCTKSGKKQRCGKYKGCIRYCKLHQDVLVLCKKSSASMIK